MGYFKQWIDSVNTFATKSVFYNINKEACEKRNNEVRDKIKNEEVHKKNQDMYYEQQICESHRQWVRDIFSKNKPTTNFLEKEARNSKRDYWLAYGSNYMEGDNSIKICDNHYEKKDIPGVYKYRNYPIISKHLAETGCNEVYKMMQELNKQKGWNLNIINKCDGPSDFKYVDAIW